MKESLKKITFGIRFKISGVIIVTVVFISAMIGMALYNKQINDNREEMLRLGSTIIRGGESRARDYFNSSAEIEELYSMRKRSASVLSGLRRQKRESLNELMNYFPDMVKRERLLDISFLVRLGMKGKKSREEYIYFERKKPGIFSRSGYDPELENSIVKYFRTNVSVDSRLAYAAGRKEGETSFVLVGYPVLKSARDRRFYSGYLAVRERDRFAGAEALIKAKASLRNYRKTFIRRTVDADPFIGYTVSFRNMNEAGRAFRFIMRNFSASRGGLDIRGLRERFTEELGSPEASFKISSADFREAARKTLKAGRWRMKKGTSEKDIWKKMFPYLSGRGIKTEFSQTTDSLALSSFNSDLAGILGITLHRKTFYSGLEQTEKEIINLSVSIFIRCLFIAFFFPGFIIKSVRALSLGAEQIGKGDFDYRIAVKSNDELGRLAGIFNTMAGNLKHAQSEMLEKQRMEGELVTAREIQNALLPESMPEMKGLSPASYYSSASEAGGDYYDFIRLDDKKLAVVVADVSGHGVGSGLVMAMTRTLLHMLFEKDADLRDTAGTINSYLYENTASRYFVSMFLGIYDMEKEQLRYISCGHNPSLIIRKGKAREIPAGGIAMGAVSSGLFDNALKIRTAQIGKGDILVSYTDGIVEMMDEEGNEFGEEKFFSCLEENSSLSPQEIIDRTAAEAQKFRGAAPQHDDVTMAALKIEG